MQKRVRERAHGRGLTSSYLEGRDIDDDEDDDEFSINAIKNKYKPGKDGSKSLFWRKRERENS